MVHTDETGAAPIRTYVSRRPPAAMVHTDETGAAPIRTGDKLEDTVEETTVNTVVPSVTETGAPQAKSKLHEIQCTITNTQSIIVNTEKTVGAILGELVTLKGEIEEQTTLAAGLRVALRGQTAKVGLLACERDATLVVVKERERELERMRKDAQDDRKKLEQGTLASLTAMETEQQRLIFERGELKREKAGLSLLLNKTKATLQCKLESAVTSTRAEKGKCDILIANTLLERKLMEEKYLLVVGEKDITILALARVKVKLMQQCDDIVKMERSTHNLKSDYRKLADQLSMMGKEVDNAKNEMMSQKAMFEESVVDRNKVAEDLLVALKDAMSRKAMFEELLVDRNKVADDLLVAHKDATLQQALFQELLANRNNVANDLLFTRKEASVKKRRMEVEHKAAFDTGYSKLKDSNGDLKQTVQSMGKRKNELEIECATIQEELLKEREKSLCQICVETPKDTVCLPCMHFHYCSICLEKHKRRSRTCPFCRTILSGTLKSDISMQS